LTFPRRLAIAALAAIVLSLSIEPHALAQGTRVAIAQGGLRGESADGVRSFRNIPYAAPPVGDLRWRPPARPSAWQGERDATKFGAHCPQPRSQSTAAGGFADRQNEDCLQLNIFAPEGASKLPVMVWIHGGAHRIGSAAFPFYEGADLARQGVVVVTVNYRLGLLGYFAHPALTAEAAADEPLGNFGLMDQLAALRWVQSNIEAFGGDPARVTVFGESAGGSCIVYLLANPASRGLFAQAIVQSGGGLQIPQTLADREELGRASAERIGLAANATAKDLRAQPAERFADAPAGSYGNAFGPFVDGRLVREAPWRAFAEKRDIDVPLLIGANSNEASVFAQLGVPMSAAAQFLGPALEAARRAYGEALAPEEFARQAMGDTWFVAPARWLAGAAAGGAPSFLYHFSYVAEARRGVVPGAGHGSEILYIFQTWRQFPALRAVLNATDDKFSRDISACWVAFAKSGRPACPLANGWPAYDPSTDRLFEFAAVSGVRTGFRKPQLDILLSRFFAIQPPSK
jgi:para-nitrobenzyl esterase